MWRCGRFSLPGFFLLLLSGCGLLLAPVPPPQFGLMAGFCSRNLDPRAANDCWQNEREGEQSDFLDEEEEGEEDGEGGLL